MILKASLHGVRSIPVIAGLFTLLAASPSVGEEITLNCDLAIPDIKQKIEKYHADLEKSSKPMSLKKRHRELSDERAWVGTNCSRHPEWKIVPSLRPLPTEPAPK